MLTLSIMSNPKTTKVVRISNQSTFTIKLLKSHNIPYKEELVRTIQTAIFCPSEKYHWKLLCIEVE